MGKLAIGVVHYLNAWPLAWGLWRGEGGADCEVHDLSPAAVAHGLAAGTLDVGLVPSIELARQPGLVPVADLGIAALEEVRSVLLLARRPLAEVASVAVDDNSRTSVALLRLLLAARGLSPRFAAEPPRLDEMLARHDAALVIGDPALVVERERYSILDLAAAWRELTGLPFVFALWAARPGAASARLAALLRASYAAGRRDFDALVTAAAGRARLPERLLRDYFERHLRYELGDAERAGLSEFLARARASGLAGEPIAAAAQP